jgi:predicted small secreted protein
LIAIADRDGNLAAALVLRASSIQTTPAARSTRRGCGDDINHGGRQVDGAIGTLDG